MEQVILLQVGAGNFETNTVIFMLKTKEKDNLEIGLFYYNKKMECWSLESQSVAEVSILYYWYDVKLFVNCILRFSEMHTPCGYFRNLFK